MIGMSIGETAEELALISVAAQPDEYADMIRYLNYQFLTVVAYSLSLHLLARFQEIRHRFLRFNSLIFEDNDAKTT